MDFLEDALDCTIDYCRSLLELNRKNETIIKMHRDIQTTSEAIVYTVAAHSEMKDHIIRTLMEENDKRDEIIKKLHSLVLADAKLRMTSDFTINLLQDNIKARDEKLILLNDKLKVEENKVHIYEEFVQQFIQNGLKNDILVQEPEQASDVAPQETEKKSTEVQNRKRSSSECQESAKKAKKD